MTPAVTINATFRAGGLHEPADRPGWRSFTGRVLDRGTTHRSADVLAEALDDRGVSLRRRASPPHDCRHVHLPGGGLRRRARDRAGHRARRRRSPSTRSRSAQAEIDDRDPAGRGQPGGPRGRDAVRAAVRRRTSVRPSSQGHAESIETIDARRSRRASTARASRPPRCRWRSSATSSRRMRRRGGERARRLDGRRSPSRLVPPPLGASTRRAALIDLPGKSQADIAYGFTTHPPPRSALLRLFGDEQHPRPVRAWRPARGQHPRASGHGLLRLQRVRSERRRGAARSSAPASIRRTSTRAIAAIDHEVGAHGSGGPTPRRAGADASSS